MSLVGEIFEELWNTSFNYKGWRVNIFGVPRFMLRNRKSLGSTLYRLKSGQYINSDDNGWYITNKGRKYYRDRKQFKNFCSFSEKESPKNLLLMFDVPIEKNNHRDWLRRQLQIFGYIMIQRSVWVGPSPLPKAFVSYTKEIGLKNNIKTFRLAKGYQK